MARHAEAVATVRSFAERSGALRVVLLIDAGEGGATMLDCAGGVLELTDSDQAVTIPADTRQERSCVRMVRVSPWQQAIAARSTCGGRSCRA